MKDNIILVDCDGVLCDWEYSFTQWMNHKGFPTIDDQQYNVGVRFGISREYGKDLVEEFNNSAAIGFLPPLRDAVYYMKRLNMLHGYRFHCITSLSVNKYAQRLRTQNLELLFGEGIFDEYVFLGCGADKTEVLAKYEDTECYWIEDKPKNAEIGASFGLNSIILAHDHNAYYEGYIPRYWKWKEIYKHIAGE